MNLEPKFSITNSINNSLAVIERARGFLQALALPANILKPMQDRAFLLEAHYTTHIEGTQLTLEQSQRILLGEEVLNINPHDKQEVLNYKKAFELVTSYLGHGEPITENLIKQIHKELVQGVRGDEGKPGEYRQIQNYVANMQTRKIIYTPPLPNEVPALMTELVGWLNKECSIHPIIISGIAQFQLVHIHPFADGNGRTARLLSTLYMYKSGYDFKRLFTVSEYYDRNRKDYYNAIQGVRENNMDLTGWLEYFTLGLSTQMQEVSNDVKVGIEQRFLVKNFNLSDRQKIALEHIFKHGHIRIQEFAKFYVHLNKRTLQRELKDMVDKGILIAQGSTNNVRYILKDRKINL